MAAHKRVHTHLAAGPPPLQGKQKKCSRLLEPRTNLWDRQTAMAAASAATAAAALEDIRDELQCPMCLELFQEPILLSCSHNLCLNCVKRLADFQFFAAAASAPPSKPAAATAGPAGGVPAASSARVMFDSHQLRSIVCPVCRRETKLSNEDRSA